MKKEPQPLWTRVAPGASRKEIEDRIAVCLILPQPCFNVLTPVRQIREFFLRFSEALNVKRPLLEALEDFAWMERDVAVGCLAALVDALRLDRPADTRKVCVMAFAVLPFIYRCLPPALCSHLEGHQVQRRLLW